MSQSGSMGKGVMGELDPLIGRTISGRYRVHQLIGQGGMGKVFQAQQIPLGRAVALKVLGMTHAAESDAEFQQRFFHEAAILARLKSPYTVTVFDYGRDGDIYFIAMELVLGKPLDRVLREQGVLSPAHAVTIAIQIARSLREAHALGVVHRDLKPANVLVAHTADGEENVKVLDFGLAKQWSVAVDDTNRDVVPGSPKYMAPEVIRQEPVDGRADIYALGILLYHMVTGRVPFDAHSPLDILMAHVQQPPPPMAQANPNVAVPHALEQLVLRCLAKRPEQRYQTMQEVIDALRGLAGVLGMGSDMAGMSMLPPAAFATSAGGTHSPSGQSNPQSGAQRRTPSGAPRSSDAPRLRLDHRDVTPSGTKMKRGAMAKKLWLPIAIATACGVLGALAVSMFMSRAESADAPPAPPEPPAMAQPNAPTPIAPTAQLPAATGGAGTLDDEAPVMDFSDQLAIESEAAKARTGAAPRSAPTTPSGASTGTTGARASLPSVTITARSIPTGAAVIVRGTRMGLTPLTFRFQDAAAKSGSTLAVVFQLEGYESRTVSKTIGGQSLLVDAVLPKLAAAETEAEETEEVSEDDSELESDDSLDEKADRALRALQERAAKLEEKAPPPKRPVLQITETDP